MSFNAESPGVWRELFAHALVLMRDMQKHTSPNAVWTFGGGTVLMLRHGHRLSKDIDLFVPDAQSLGFVNPRLSDTAAEICADYIEASEYIKLLLPEGEIDIVAAHNLTDHAWTLETILGEVVRVETDVEIVAKKMWHRGSQATARDLFDLVLVIQTDPVGLACQAQWLIRHRDVFLHQLQERRDILQTTFDAIMRLREGSERVPGYSECAAIARRFLLTL